MAPPFDASDPYELQNRGPQRADVVQSWDALGGGAPQPQPQPASQATPQQAPASILPEDRAALMRARDNAVLGIRPEDEMRAEALSRATGKDISPLLVQAHTRIIPGSAGHAAGYIPVSRQTQTTGTMAEEGIEEMRERGTTRLALGDTAAREQAAADRDVARIQEDEALKQYGTSREEYDAWESNLSDRQRKLLDEMHGIAQERVDPGRIFQDRGVAGSALSIIGDSMRAYAASMQRMPFASQLQADIDRDVALQADELGRKKDQKQTELGRLVEESGDLRQARMELTAKQQAYSVARLARLAREAQEPAIQAHLDAETAAMSSQLGDTLTALKYGTQSTAESEAYRQAQGATAAREVVDMPGVLAAAQASIPKDDRADMAELGKERGPSDVIVSTIGQIAAENGMILNPETLQLEPKDGVSGFGFFESRMPNGALTEQAKRTRAQMASVVMGKVHEAFGAANPEQVEMLRKQMLGSETEEDFSIAVNEALRMAKVKIQQANAARPHVARQYEDSLRKEQSRGRAQTKARAEAQQRSIEADQTAGIEAPKVSEPEKPSGYRGLRGYSKDGAR